MGNGRLHGWQAMFDVLGRGDRSRRIFGFTSVAAALALTACQPNSPGHTSGRAHVPATLTSASTATGGTDREKDTVESPAVRERMREHAEKGAALRDDVARGDLEAVHRSAKVLAELRIEGPLDSTWRRHLDAMNVAAGRVVDAKNITEASRRTAVLAEACGSCHAALGGGAPAVASPPAEASGVVPRMRRHEWAAARLWDGLVVPSSDAWLAGARVLADAPLEPEALTPGMTPVKKIDDMTREVHELGKKAAGMTTPQERASAYAEVLASCAGCHQWLGGGPPVDSGARSSSTGTSKRVSRSR